MKGLVRFILLLIILSLPLLYLLKNILLDLSDQYRVASYLDAYLNHYHVPYSVPQRKPGATPEDKVVVMGRLEEDETDWVTQELPDWQHAIYTVNPTTETTNDASILKTPLNKGHESMAYLTYIIDHYHHLPSTIVFLHAHRAGFLMAWHVDTPLHDNVAALRALRLDFVQENGYVNLRCNWNPGCLEAHRVNRHVTELVWREVFDGTSTPPSLLNDTNTHHVGNGDDVGDGATDNSHTTNQQPVKFPHRVGAACCAQFAVSRSQVLQRPRDDYIRFREWVTRTDKDSASSGRVMEFLWHIFFGKDAVYCPDEELCYCQVYGRC